MMLHEFEQSFALDVNTVLEQILLIFDVLTSK